MNERNQWKMFAALAANAGLTTLGSALLPGAPVAGRLLGQAASEVLTAKLAPDVYRQVAQAGTPEDLDHEVLKPVNDALSRTHSEIKEHDGYFEFTMPRHFVLREIEDHESHLLEPPDPHFFQASLDALGDLRKVWGRPMRLTSAWRSLHHSVESKKPADALHRHTMGAFDIAISGAALNDLEDLVSQMGGWTGRGRNQKGAHRGRFIHLDRIAAHAANWTY